MAKASNQASSISGHDKAAALKLTPVSRETEGRLVGSAEPAAIRALLCNQTAQIREATLDALAAQSEQHAEWQEPLVHRAHLSPRAQRMLSEIVTGHLLEALAARSDLDPKVGQSSRVRAGPEWARDGARVVAQGDGVPQIEVDPQTAVDEAEALLKTGRLDDYTILDALRINRIATAKAMLAVKAGVTVPIERACTLRSARAIVSLAWQAELSAQTSVAWQTMLANLAPDQVLRPTKNAGFPLSEDEMRWQLAFLGDGDKEQRAWNSRRL